MSFLVSPHTHFESPLTGSTIGTMVKKAKSLGRTHVAYTDHGHLSSALKTYAAVKKAGMKFIPGIEIYFKDSNCPITSGTTAARCKYFTVTLYCQDQDAYQELCKQVSRTDFPTMEINDEVQQLWSWADLETMSKFNTSIVLSGVHCMVGKCLLAGAPEAGLKVFEKLKGLFYSIDKEFRFVSALICEPWTKQFNSVVEIIYADGSRDALLASDTVTTEKARRIKASDLAERGGHFRLYSLTKGNTYYEVNKAIKEVKLHKGFLPLPGGDATLRVNQFLFGLHRRYITPIMATDYAYYANKEDKIVQTMRLEGNNKLQPNLHMKTSEEIETYLKGTLGLDQAATDKIVQNCSNWATQFDNLTLKYEWRLAEVEGSAIQNIMKIVKDVGRMKWDNPTYMARLKEELDVIHRNGIYDLAPYFLPIRDVLNAYLEAGLLTGPGRGCLTGDTKVLSVDGFKPLKDIIAGDRVYSHTGEVRYVTNTMEYEVSETLLEIISDFSFGSIKLTQDHKLYGVKSKNTQKYDNFLKTDMAYEFKEKKTDVEIDKVSWMKAEEFSVGDYLFTPWPKNREVRDIPDLDLSKFCSNILDLHPYHFEYGTSSDRKKVVRNFHFDARSVRIIGRWIGDGWINSDDNSKTIGIAYHLDDIDGQQDFFSFMEDLGFMPKKIIHKTKKLVQIIVYSAILHGAFKYLFPDYERTSRTKYIGKFIYLNDSLLRELLIGVQQADGHIYISGGKKGIVRENIDTTSARLANEIKQALWYLKIPSSVNTRKSYVHPQNDAWVCAESYKVRFKGLTTPKSKTIIENNEGYLAKISNIKEFYENKVYDITVEKDHSYVTSNYAVHNSAGGSLLCYLMGITQIDPFDYDLPFQRFFSMVRIKGKKLPDIDVDLEDRTFLVGEDGQSGYLYNRWDNKAAQISTRTTIRLKSAIKDTNRYFHGSVQEEIETLTKGLPPPPQGVSDLNFVFGFEDDEGNHIPGIIEQSEELKKYSEERPEEWAIVSKAMGLTRAYSSHASAFVISDVPIKYVIPTKNGNITQYEAKEVEAAGLIKYDFLVVKQLKDIRVAMDLIKKKAGRKDLPVTHFPHKGTDTFIWKLAQDDSVFRSIWSGQTETMFQINTPSMKPHVINMLPQNMVDLATLLALVRPGPLDFIDENTGRNMVEEYMLRRRGEAKPDIPEMAELLPETFGILAFQEQLGKIARDLCGFSGEDAELLRENMAKKKMEELMKMKPLFMEGAIKKIPFEVADKIWNQMVTFGRYGFSVIHAVEYAHITYACMFLKHYYPLEWWAAILTNATEQEITGKFWPFVKDMVAAPDINLSSDVMVVDYANEKLRSKFGVLRGMGEKTIAPLVENRPYSDITDYVNKKVAGSSLTHKLIHVGVLDSLFPPKISLYDKLKLYQNALEIKTYKEKVEKAAELKKKIRATQPKEGQVPSEYINLPPMLDAAMKKAVLPSMPLNLFELGSKHSKVLAPYITRPIVKSARDYDTILLNGEQLQRLDQLDGDSIKEDIYVAATCFVVEAKEFPYSKNTKRALKMVLDSDGYVSEKVLWPEYESGKLVYPAGLKKGAIATFFFRKRVNKKDMSIMSVTLETDNADYQDEAKEA